MIELIGPVVKSVAGEDLWANSHRAGKSDYARRRQHWRSVSIVLEICILPADRVTKLGLVNRREAPDDADTKINPAVELQPFLKKPSNRAKPGQITLLATITWPKCRVRTSGDVGRTLTLNPKRTACHRPAQVHADATPGLTNA